MRSPVLIAETPFAAGDGPRYLAPSGRQVDADVASYYIGRVREVENDVEEVEGDDYLAVQRLLTEESSGQSAPEILVLAGIDVDRMSSTERDEVLDQLRERLEVLGDAVAAINWMQLRDNELLEIPELDEWHEASWDALPRIGPWADPEAEQAPEPSRTEEEAPVEEEVFRGHNEVQAQEEPVSENVPDECEAERHEVIEPSRQEEPAALESPTAEAEAQRGEEPAETPSVEVASAEAEAQRGDESEPPRFASASASASEVVEPATVPPAPVILELPLHHTNHEPAPSHGPVTVMIQVIADPKAMQAESEPEPVPDVIVPAREPIVAPPPPVDPPIKLSSIDPVQVSASIDRSPALAPISPAAVEPTPEKRRGLRWWVWFPWTATAMLLLSGYLYLSQVDRTWNQRLVESHYAQGATRVVERPVEVEKIVEKERIVERIVEKPVDRIVEKIVEKPVAAPTADMAKQEQWAKFALGYRGLIASQDLITAAELLSRSEPLLPAWGKEVPPELDALRTEYRSMIGARLSVWANGRAGDRRFADAYLGLTSFAAADPVKALITPAAAAELASKARAEVRAAEDEFHYTQIRKLAAAETPSDETLAQHINAYTSLVAPSGKHLAAVQLLAAHRQWLKDGQPVKAVVKIEWGPRVLACDHRVDFEFGSGKSAQTFDRTIAAEPGKVWTDSFAVKGIGALDPRQYRIKTVRSTTPLEELAENLKRRTELFLFIPLTLPTVGPVAPLTATDDEVVSGTKVTVEWLGFITPPTLGDWKMPEPIVVPVAIPR